MRSYQVTIAIDEEVNVKKEILNELHKCFDIEKTINGIKYWYADEICWNYGLKKIKDFLVDLDEEQYGAVAMNQDWTDCDTLGDFGGFDIYPGQYPFKDEN